MAANRHRRCEGRWIFSIVTGLLLALIPLMAAWPQGKAVSTGHTRQRGLEKRPQVVVQRGRLFVDLRQADLGEVLAAIGQQAGIRMVLGPSAGQRISAQFAGVELEAGLRRLLRLASLNYTILYAPESVGRCASTWSLTSCWQYLILQAPPSAGGGAIQEVRVFGEEKEGTPPQRIAGAEDVEERVDHPDNPFFKAWQQVEATRLLSPGSEQREAARRLRALHRPGKARGEDIPTPTNPGDDPGQQGEERGGATASSR